MDSFQFFVPLWLSQPNESLTEYKVPKWVGNLKVIYCPVAQGVSEFKVAYQKKLYFG